MVEAILEGVMKEKDVVRTETELLNVNDIS